MRLKQSLFGVLVLLICSCQLLETSSPELVINVDADIELNLREKLPSDGNGFYLKLTSSDTFDCAGLEYHCEYTFQSSRFLFNVIGLKNTQDCEGSSYHVTSDVLLYPPNGTYTVRFVIGEDIENIGTMVINDERINLTFPEIYGLRIPHETLYRIPRGTVWGYLAGEGDLESAYAWVETNFMPHGRIPDLKPGFYGYFIISDVNSESRIYPQPDSGHYRSFVFHLEDDEASLDALKKSFSETFDESVKLELSTWTGSQF